MTRGEKVCKFISVYCAVPEGAHVGQPMRLLPFQRKFIIDIYDNPAGTSRAYLSIARKNGKSATIAALVLAHLVGPVATLNSQIISGAQSRDQAAIIYKLAEKMVNLNPELRKLVRSVPSSKMLVGLPMNVEFRSIAAESRTAHGLSPVVAILDEIGQVQGPRDEFVEAIETSQGAHAAPLLIAISTQAATHGDMFSQWLDDAAASHDPRIVSHVHTAPEGCELMDRAAWAKANPALGEFRSATDMEDFAARALRLPSSENSFRWLFLNQRIEANAPFISRGIWESCNAAPLPLDGVPVFAGLDLSSTNDLTALVLIGQVEGVWQVHPFFWLPAAGLREKARADRVPYDVWYDQGLLLAAPGKSVDYEYVASYLRGLFDQYDIQKLAFDRWGFKHLKPWLLKAGFEEDEIASRFVEFGQGMQSMSPALRELEGALLNQRIAHGGHPVLTMNMAGAVVRTDPAGNRKLDKAKSRSRIDGAVGLVMAHSAAAAAAEAEYDIRAMVA